jgi:hypothetical protein
MWRRDFRLETVGGAEETSTISAVCLSRGLTNVWNGQVLSGLWRGAPLRVGGAIGVVDATVRFFKPAEMAGLDQLSG